MQSPPVVLDTNVLVGAGFNPRSASARILDAVKQGKLRMMWNEETRREILRIMQQIPPMRSLDVSQSFLESNRVTSATHPDRFAVVADPDDRKFAALAHEAGAALISSDEHLLSCCDAIGVLVLTPGAYWRQLQLAEQSGVTAAM
jgi:predicted nucleic acid-binding protein